MKQKNHVIKRIIATVIFLISIMHNANSMQIDPVKLDFGGCIDTTECKGIIPMLQELIIKQIIFGATPEDANRSALKIIKAQTKQVVLCQSYAICTRLILYVQDLIKRSKDRTLQSLSDIIESQFRAQITEKESTDKITGIFVKLEKAQTNGEQNILLLSCMESQGVWPQNCDTVTPDTCCDVIPCQFNPDVDCCDIYPNYPFDPPCP